MSVFSKACACTLFGAIAALSPITLSNASFIGAAWANGAEAGGKARINLSVKLKTLGQEIAAAACNIGADFDTDAAREELKIARSDFRKILAALEFGDELLGIPTAESQKKTLGAIERIKVVWQPLDLASDTLLFNGDTAAAAQMIAEQNLALLDATDVLAAQLAGQYSDPEQLAQIDAMAIGIAGRQRMFSQQLKKEACELNSSVSGITDPSSFQNTVEVFERSLVALRDGLPEAGVRPPPNDGIREELNLAWGKWSEAKPVLEGLAKNGSSSSDDIAQVNQIAHALLLNMDNIVTRYLIAIPGSEDIYRVPLRGFAEDELAGWTTEPLIISALNAQNAGNRTMLQPQIDALDLQWRAETKLDVHPLIDDLMSRPASSWLREKQIETAGFVTEVFVMDNLGNNVAQSAVTSDYWQGDEAKWQETFGNGSGEIHISEVEFDESTQVYQSQVSMPIFDPATRELIGAVTFGVNVQSLL